VFDNGYQWLFDNFPITKFISPGFPASSHIKIVPPLLSVKQYCRYRGSPLNITLESRPHYCVTGTGLFPTGDTETAQ